MDLLQKVESLIDGLQFTYSTKALPKDLETDRSMMLKNRFDVFHDFINILSTFLTKALPTGRTTGHTPSYRDARVRIEF